MKSRTRPAFSVAAILRNESRALPRLLDSLADFRSRGGEVVVLDTGSSDETVSIATEAGCVVARAPRRFNRVLTAEQAERISALLSKNGESFAKTGDRIFNFAGARNAADALARKNFVMAVDGCDIVEAMDVEFIDAHVRANDAAILLFETRRLHRGHWVLELRDYLHDRRRVRWFGRAHNQIVPARPNQHPRGVPLPPDRLRVTHHTDESKQRGHQLTGMALDVLESPHASQRRLVLGHELFARGFVHSALSLFEGLDQEGVSRSVRSVALSMAALCLARLRGPSDEAVTDLLFRAARRDPGHRDPLLQLARLSLEAGGFQAAASFAMAALAIPPRVTFTQLEENLRDGPHAILYWALLWLGRPAEAREHHRICITMDPANPVYRDHARLLA